MAEGDVSGTARIAAPADELYRLVSDVTRMGEWSPENVGGRWVGGATAPVVGAQFQGSNRRGWRQWSTTCTVVAADPARRFEFEVAFGPVPVSRWSYEFEPEGGATVVTETWTDRRPAWFSLLAAPVMGVGDIRGHHQQNIDKTLANLRAAAERPS